MDDGDAERFCLFSLRICAAKYLIFGVANAIVASVKGMGT